MKWCWLFATVLAVTACSSRQRPAGPAPEYERPVVMPWDSGAPVDPFEKIEGEEVTDDEEPEPEAADAGAEGVAEAGDAAVDAMLSPEGGAS